jgi:hypothetical protein
VADYFQRAGLNWSSLKHIRPPGSPLRFKWHQQHPQKDTDTFALGRATHAAVFEPDRFLTDFVAWDVPTKKGGKVAPRNGKAWDEFRAEHSHQTILTITEMRHATDIGDAVRRHDAARRFIEDPQARFEVELSWVEQGFEAKAKVDCVSPAFSMFLDLKTDAVGIAPFSFGRTMDRMGYAHQMAWYRRGLKANGFDFSPALVPVEKSPPYDVAVYEIGDDSLDVVDNEIDELLALLRRCQECDEWPGAHPGLGIVDLPRWRLDTDTEDTEDQDLDWSKDNDGQEAG